MPRADRSSGHALRGRGQRVRVAAHERGGILWRQDQPDEALGAARDDIVDGRLHRGLGKTHASRHAKVGTQKGLECLGLRLGDLDQRRHADRGVASAKLRQQYNVGLAPTPHACHVRADVVQVAGRAVGHQDDAGVHQSARRL